MKKFHHLKKFVSLTCLIFLCTSLKAEKAEKALQTHLKKQEDPFAISWQKDGPLLFASFSLFAWGQYQLSEMQTSSPKSPYFAWDKPFKGRDLKWPAHLSDWMLVSALLPFSLTYKWVQEERLPVHAFWTDAIILSEILAINSGINLWTRSQKVWARPHRFNSPEKSIHAQKPESLGSFYSGHASNAFAIASFTHFIYRERAKSFNHLEQKPSSWVPITAYSAAALTSGLRVMAGKHYPSDVIMGALIGMGIGYLNSWFHQIPKNRPRNLSLGLGAGGKMSVFGQIAF